MNAKKEGGRKAAQKKRDQGGPAEGERKKFHKPLYHIAGCYCV